MRKAVIERKTSETDIRLSLDLDGGSISVETGIGFFDHMLKSFACHAGFGLQLKCAGDLDVDGHHTVEDVGISLGLAFCEAIGEKRGIRRFASCYVPMDESLCLAATDISGRPFLEYRVTQPQVMIGDYDSCLSEEFFRAFAMNARVTLHIRLEYGWNSHHITEAAFKAAARALGKASEITGVKIPSTKGSL